MSFSDIVGGIGTNSVMEVNGIDSNDSVFITFKNCQTASHNSTSPTPTMFTYTGFTINVTGTQSGNFHCNVFQQRRLILENDINKSSLAYRITSTTPANTNFISDSTAWLSYIDSTSVINNIISLPNSATTIANDDLIIFSDTSDYKNIKSIEYKYISGGTGSSSEYSPTYGEWVSISQFSTTASVSAITTTSDYTDSIKKVWLLDCQVKQVMWMILLFMV